MDLAGPSPCLGEGVVDCKWMLPASRLLPSLANWFLPSSGHRQTQQLELQRASTWLLLAWCQSCQTFPTQLWGASPGGSILVLCPSLLCPRKELSS